jgi:hypothetical protein
LPREKCFLYVDQTSLISLWPQPGYMPIRKLVMKTWVIDEIKEEIKTFLEVNENEN